MAEHLLCYASGSCLFGRRKIASNANQNYQNQLFLLCYFLFHTDSGWLFFFIISLRRNAASIAINREIITYDYCEKCNNCKNFHSTNAHRHVFNCFQRICAFSTFPFFSLRNRARMLPPLFFFG